MTGDWRSWGDSTTALASADSDVAGVAGLGRRGGAAARVLRGAGDSSIATAAGATGGAAGAGCATGGADAAGGVTGATAAASAGLAPGAAGLAAGWAGAAAGAGGCGGEEVVRTGGADDSAGMNCRAAVATEATRAPQDEQAKRPGDSGASHSGQTTVLVAIDHLVRNAGPFRAGSYRLPPSSGTDQSPGRWCFDAPNVPVADRRSRTPKV